jgi:hypothetical protein
MVSTVQKGIGTALKKIKNLRENKFNKKHVREERAGGWCANMDVPGCTDDYNNKMSRVDKA